MLSRALNTLVEWAAIAIFTVVFVICDILDRLFGARDEDDY